jgi:hypothetical protein
MEKEDASTGMEPLFNFLHAEHGTSNKAGGGCGAAHSSFTSAATEPLFDFRNDDLLLSFEFQPGMETSMSTALSDDLARRTLPRPPLVCSLCLSPPFSCIERHSCYLCCSIGPSLSSRPAPGGGGGGADAFRTCDHFLQLVLSLYSSLHSGTIGRVWVRVRVQKHLLHNVLAQYQHFCGRNIVGFF